MVQKLSTCKWLNKNYEKERYFIGVLLRKTNEQQKPSTNPIRVPPPATMKNLILFLNQENHIWVIFIWYGAYQVKLSEINPWWMTGRYWFHLQLMAPCQEKTWTDCYKLEPRTPYQRADDVPVEVLTLINPYLENLK